MARFALSWGGGTHFDDPDFIGKFGFGLPNASINQTRRVEVYTKPSGPAAQPGYVARADFDATTSVALIVDGRHVADVPVLEMLP